MHGSLWPQWLRSSETIAVLWQYHWHLNALWYVYPRENVGMRGIGCDYTKKKIHIGSVWKKPIGSEQKCIVNDRRSILMFSNGQKNLAFVLNLPGFAKYTLNSLCFNPTRTGFVRMQSCSAKPKRWTHANALIIFNYATGMKRWLSITISIENSDGCPVSPIPNCPKYRS